MARDWRGMLADEAGATAIEYALLIGLIGLVIAVSATAIGTDLAAIFDKADAPLKTTS